MEAVISSVKQSDGKVLCWDGVMVRRIVVRRSNCRKSQCRV